MIKERTYTTVTIPISIMEKVEEIIKKEKFGYRSKTDFILDATRKRLRELGALP